MPTWPHPYPEIAFITSILGSLRRASLGVPWPATQPGAGRPRGHRRGRHQGPGLQARTTNVTLLRAAACLARDMVGLAGAILAIFDDEGSHRASAGHLIDCLDRKGIDFELDEFDAATEALQDTGKIRVKNPRAPMYDRIILRR